MKFNHGTYDDSSVLEIRRMVAGCVRVYERLLREGETR